MIRFASLGSGSQGNGLVVAAGEGAVLVDCGFSLRGTEARLARLGMSPADLCAILVTHEHSDHLAGVFTLARRYGLPVHLTHGTWSAAESRLAGRADAVRRLCRPIRADADFTVGALTVRPFAVPHDAREPVQFVFSAAGRRLGMLTDCGRITPHVVDVLSPCDALVLEFNHDRERLAVSSYPPSLRARIAGGYGHLENAQALSLLQTLDVGRLQHLVAAHLSEENNCPRAVEALLASLFAGDRRRFDIADQADGHGWRTLT